MAQSGETPFPKCAEPGQVLAGKYLVGQILGRGGMGVVVAATHTELDQAVAIKLLLDPSMATGEAGKRFAREARAAAKIRSEYVVRVLDVARLEDGSPYMVMEHLDGNDLEAELRGGPLRVEDAALYLLQACDALVQAHSLGIVHRDLKPANLFLAKDRDGQPSLKVLDFGISKLLAQGGASTGLTQTASLMGSPRYMSPEQMQSAKGVDARADIWAIGAILFELLSGKPAFEGDTLPQVCAAVMLSEPRSLSDLKRNVPPELVRLVHHCLNKNPAKRPSSTVDVAIALAPFAGEIGKKVLAGILRSSQGAPVRVPSDRSSKTHKYSSPTVGRTTPGWTRPMSSSRGGSAAVLVGVAAILAAMVFWMKAEPVNLPGLSAGAIEVIADPVEPKVQAAPRVVVVDVVQEEPPVALEAPHVEEASLEEEVPRKLVTVAELVDTPAVEKPSVDKLSVRKVEPKTEVKTRLSAKPIPKVGRKKLFKPVPRSSAKAQTNPAIVPKPKETQKVSPPASPQPVRRKTATPTAPPRSPLDIRLK